MTHQVDASFSPRLFAVIPFFVVAMAATNARNTTATAMYPRFAQPNTVFGVK